LYWNIIYNHINKIYKSGDIILIEDNYKISYEIESKRNIFLSNNVNIKYPICIKNLSECICMSLDTDPYKIKFEPTILENHLRQAHKDEIIYIKKKSKIDINKQICEFSLI
jgi:hypothetical protein